jgi:hypothetical protein
LDYNVDACMLEANIYLLSVDDSQQMKCTTKLVNVKFPSNSTLVVEFNLMESPTSNKQFGTLIQVLLTT